MPDSGNVPNHLVSNAKTHGKSNIKVPVPPVHKPGPIAPTVPPKLVPSAPVHKHAVPK